MGLSAYECLVFFLHAGLLYSGTSLKEDENNKEEYSFQPTRKDVAPMTTVPIINPTTPTTSTPIANPMPPPTLWGYPTTPNPIMTPPATTAPSSGQTWCVASQSASQTALQVALDYACGYGGADCSAIQPGGSCYNPDTVRDHASYAFNSYYQKNPIPTSCDFGGTATVTSTDPSTSNCQFPSSSSSSSTPTPIPNTGTPTTPIPNMDTPPTPIPNMGNPTGGSGPPVFGSSGPPTSYSDTDDTGDITSASSIFSPSILMGFLVLTVACL